MGAATYAGNLSTLTDVMDKHNFRFLVAVITMARIISLKSLCH